MLPQPPVASIPHRPCPPDEHYFPTLLPALSQPHIALTVRCADVSDPTLPSRRALLPHPAGHAGPRERDVLRRQRRGLRQLDHWRAAPAPLHVRPGARRGVGGPRWGARCAGPAAPLGRPRGQRTRWLQPPAPTACSTLPWLLSCRAEEVTYERVVQLRSLIADKDLQPQLCVGEPSIKGAPCCHCRCLMLAHACSCLLMLAHARSCSLA